MGKNVFLYCPSDMVIYVPKASVESYRKAEQPEKVETSIEVTEFGMEMLVRAEQPEKAYSPIEVTEFGMEMLFKLVQS